MSRDIIIAGENGELYHITEDQLRAAHHISPEAEPDARRLMDMVPEHAATASVHLPEHEEWYGGASTCACDNVQLLKLGATHDEDK